MKAWDIIPEIQKVIVPAIKAVELPIECPSCKSNLTFDGIHLMCQNDSCVGKIAK